MDIECYKEKTKIFKALSDVNRLRIIDILSCEEQCGCQILAKFDFTQPTLSHHMKILIDSGLVVACKKGTWNYYKLNCENIKELKEFINTLFNK